MDNDDRTGISDLQPGNMMDPAQMGFMEDPTEMITTAVRKMQDMLQCCRDRQNPMLRIVLPTAAADKNKKLRVLCAECEGTGHQAHTELADHDCPHCKGAGLFSYDCGNIEVAFIELYEDAQESIMNKKGFVVPIGDPQNTSAIPGMVELRYETLAEWSDLLTALGSMVEFIERGE